MSVPEGLGSQKLSRGFWGDRSLPRLKDAAGSDDVTSLNQLAEVGRLKTVCCEPILGEFEIDCLRQDASTFHLRCLWSALQGAGDEIGEVVQLGIAVVVARGCRQLFA